MICSHFRLACGPLFHSLFPKQLLEQPWDWPHLYRWLELESPILSWARSLERMTSQCTSNNTLESSSFVGNQCLWLSWIILAHEFTSPRMYIQAFVKYLLKCSRICYQRNMSPRTKKTFAVHEHWPPQK